MTAIRFELLRAGARLPERSRPGDAGLDVFAPEAVLLKAGVVTKVGLGFAADPGPGLWLQLAGRSGLASRGLLVLGGVVDPGYRGEVSVLLYQLPALDITSVVLPAGSRIAQLLVHPVMAARTEVSYSLPESARGAAGFGSTGA